ncbi:GNAT family N-acetyltransferase [bacterium]|nr:GNAT family N-acetyltransferase [bacterium]
MLKHFFKHCHSEYKLSVFDSVHLLNEDHWNQINSDNLFLSIPYLRALEDSIDTIDFRYLIVYNKEFKPVLSAYFQVIDFEDIDQTYSKLISQYIGGDTLKKMIDKLELRLLICGNLFACGDYGFSYSADLSEQTAFQLLRDGMKRIQTNGNGDKPSLFLVKELNERLAQSAKPLLEDRFYDFNIDHNMVMAIHPDWKNMEDYYSSLTSKFRTKMKSTLKKSEGLALEAWNYEVIDAQKEKIFELYLNVINGADFNLGELGPETLPALKKELGDQFLFKAYLYNNQLIGFSASFICDDHVDAALVGMDYNVAKEVSLYQRMLHDFVETAIQSDVPELKLGRTAEQAKSSFGALPQEMYLYMKHKNPLVNGLLKSITDKLKPSSFEMRKPFKANFEAEWTL